FDTVMSGRVSAQALAGVAIGSSLWVPIFTGVNGILLAITPIIGQLVGAKDHKEVPKKVQQGIYLAIAIAITVFIIGASLRNPILKEMIIETEVRHIAMFYLVTLITVLVPLFFCNTLRSFIDPLGQTRISMLLIILSLPLNILFNYICIFGQF